LYSCFIDPNAICFAGDEATAQWLLQRHWILLAINVLLNVFPFFKLAPPAPAPAKDAPKPADAKKKD
jgi:hypothetical protein